MINNEEYTHWVVVDGKIVSGWWYREDAIDDQKERGRGRVYARRGLTNIGLDPDKDEDWK